MPIPLIGIGTSVIVELPLWSAYKFLVISPSNEFGEVTLRSLAMMRNATITVPASHLRII